MQKRPVVTFSQRWIIGCLAALALTLPSWGQSTYHVAVDGNDANDGLDWEAPLLSIEVAVDRANDGDTVLLGPGSHNVTSLWVQVTKGITIRGLDEPENTVLQAASIEHAAAGTGARIRRVMRVDHEDARIFDLTMTDGHHHNAHLLPDFKGPGGLRLQAGVVSNCVVRGNIGHDDAGGVEVSGGLLTHTLITKNEAWRGNNASMGQGGGVWVSGGVVQHCVISNNYARAAGGGLRLTGGTVRDSLIAENYCWAFKDRPLIGFPGETPGGSWPPPIGNGAGVFMSGGVLERSRIRDNALAVRGGGIHLNGANAVVRNCLIAGNAAYEYGGVWLQAGRIANSTIVGNRALSASASGLYMSGGSVENSIVFGNGTAPYHETSDDAVKTGGSFIYSCAVPLVAGEGNIAADPLFLNAVAGDYRPGVGSPVIDAGTDLVDVTVDLDGRARPQDGNADGSEAHDMGAYEVTPIGAGPLTCSFSVAPEAGVDAVEAQFTAFAGGADTNIVWYGWDFGNNGVIDLSGPDKQTASANFGHGFHDVVLIVSNASGKAAMRLRKACVRVGSATSYVSLGGSHEAPFETPAKAATNLQCAVNAVWTASATPATVWVDEGDYAIPELWIEVTRPLSLRSLHGPDETILRPAGPIPWLQRVMRVDHPDAFVAGFTLTDGELDRTTFDAAGPGGLRLQSGVVSNCVVRGNIGSDSSGGVQVSGGLLTHSIITGNRAYRGNNAGVGQGGGIWISGGLVQYSEIFDNAANLSGGGVRMTGGRMEYSRIAANVGGLAGRTDRSGGGLYLTGGKISACIISDNTVHGSGGGAWLNGGELVNSLVVSNYAASAGGHGLFAPSGTGKILNCTVADNSYSQAGSGISLVAGTVVNSIAAFNGDLDIAQTGGSVSYSLSGNTVVGDGNRTGGPLFLNRAAFNYRLAVDSPGINHGNNEGWTETDVDLDGNPRIKFGAIDIGAYEFQGLPGTLLIFR